MFYKKKRFSFPLSFRSASAGSVAHSRPALRARTPARPRGMTQHLSLAAVPAQQIPSAQLRRSPASSRASPPRRLSRCHVDPACQTRRATYRRAPHIRPVPNLHPHRAGWRCCRRSERPRASRGWSWLIKALPEPRAPLRTLASLRDL